MERFLQQLVDGIASGAVYASLAVALVLIFRSTGIVNFAQGEMAMFSTYVAWQLTRWGLPVWGAVVLTLAFSFAGGLILERVVIRPVERASPLTVVIVTLGLLAVFNSLAGWIWSFVVRSFPSPFSESVFVLGGVRLSTQSVGTVLTLGTVIGLLYLLIQKTRLGLAMRAVASNYESARLVGIRAFPVIDSRVSHAAAPAAG